MELKKFSHTFTPAASAAEIPDSVLVISSTSDVRANGVYAWDSQNSKYVKGDYSIKLSSGAWTLFRAATAAELASTPGTAEYVVSYATDAPPSPSDAQWAGLYVLAAEAVTVQANTVATVMSVIFSGGDDGGVAVMLADGVTMPFSISPQSTLCIDAKQVFESGSIYLAAQPGMSVLFSYAVTATAAAAAAAEETPAVSE